MVKEKSDDFANADPAAELTAFDEFQLEEYKNISTSHFESVKQVSTFFKYYLLILAAPAFVLTLIEGKDKGVGPFLKGGESAIFYDLVLFYLTIIAAVGFLIFLYIVNLRHDAMLYARTVNKVRRYFYERSDLEINDFEKYLYLPITSTKPKYTEKTFFLPLVVVFLIVNTAFLFVGLYVKQLNSPFVISYTVFPFEIPLTFTTIGCLTAGFASLHILAFRYLAYRRETTYFKYHAFGIDIDGVLNNQTERFAGFYGKIKGQSQLDIDRIKEIPVHLNEDLGVTAREEKLIFNSTEYWQKLIPKAESVEKIEQFRKQFGYRIFLFTFRDWPQYPPSEADAQQMRSEIKGMSCTPMELRQIRSITHEWLQRAGLTDIYVVDGFWRDVFYSVGGRYWRPTRPFFSLSSSIKVTMEKGNPYISDTRFRRNNVLARNRFQAARSTGFRFFVEDFPENAIKLSSLCDYVFMFNEPYNSPDRFDFPKNVIRVNSWNDIYRHLKMLG